MAKKVSQVDTESSSHQTNSSLTLHLFAYCIQAGTAYLLVNQNKDICRFVSSSNTRFSFSYFYDVPEIIEGTHPCAVRNIVTVGVVVDGTGQGPKPVPASRPGNDVWRYQPRDGVGIARTSEEAAQEHGHRCEEEAGRPFRRRNHSHARDEKATGRPDGHLSTKARHNAS